MTDIEKLVGILHLIHYVENGLMPASVRSYSYHQNAVVDAKLAQARTELSHYIHDLQKGVVRVRTMTQMTDEELDMIINRAVKATINEIKGLT